MRPGRFLAFRPHAGAQFHLSMDFGIRDAQCVGLEPSRSDPHSQCGAIRTAARISSSRGGEALVPHVTACSAGPRRRSRRLFHKSSRPEGPPVVQGPALFHHHLKDDVPDVRLVRLGMICCHCATTAQHQGASLGFPGGITHGRFIRH